MQLPSFSDELIYLDANATTPILPEIVSAIDESMIHCFGNPSSSHMTGLQAKHLLESTRQLAYKVLQTESGQIIFNSGATEGIHTAVFSALVAAKSRSDLPEKPLLMYGATEHKAVIEALKHWNNILGLNAEVVAIPVDKRGILDLTFIASNASRAIMICTMAANNETGVFQDIAAIEKAIRGASKNALWLVDSVQALGKVALDFDSLSIDYATFSGHKLYAPKGVGMMWVAGSAPLTPLTTGGGQEHGLRAGTENLHGIAALRTVFEILLGKSSVRFASQEQLIQYRQQLADALQITFPDIRFNNDFSVSLPTTINFAVQGISSREIMDLFDASGIRVSSGSACSSGVTRSYVLDAMGLEDWQSEGAIRLSFGPGTKPAEIDRACTLIRALKPAVSHACFTQSDSHKITGAMRTGLIQLYSPGHCSWCYLDMENHQAFVIDPVPAIDSLVARILECQAVELASVYFTSEQTRALYQAGRWCELEQAKAIESVASQWKQLTVANEERQQLFCYQPGVTTTTLLLIAARDERELFSAGWQQLTKQMSQDDQQLTSAETLVGFSEDASGRHIGGLTLDNNVIRFPEHGSFRQISAETLLDEQKQQAGLMIDVRENFEFEAWELSHQPDTATQLLNLPLSHLADFLVNHALDTDRPAWVICRSGRRSALAAEVLRRIGVKRVSNVVGGYALLSSAEWANRDHVS